VPSDSKNYFDLEDPVTLARLEEPMTALAPLSGLVVIDEIQHRPELFPVLRVLADRQPLAARFKTRKIECSVVGTNTQEEGTKWNATKILAEIPMSQHTKSVTDQ